MDTEIPKPNIKDRNEMFNEFKHDVLKSLEKTVWLSKYSPSLIFVLPTRIYFGNPSDAHPLLEKFLYDLAQQGWECTISKNYFTSKYHLIIAPFSSTFDNKDNHGLS